MLMLIVGLTIGIGLPIQTSVNSRLRKSVGSPILASLFSFLVGTTFLAIMTVIQDKTLFFPTKLIFEQPFWIWLGGALGVIYLTTNILLFPRLGSVQTVIMPILGQIIMGLIIDNFGLFKSLKQPLTPIRIVGGSLVLMGIIGAISVNKLIVRRRNKLVDNKNNNRNLWIFRIAGIIVGMLGASQTAINGYLGVIFHSSVKAAFVSFLMGSLVLILIVIFSYPHLEIKNQFRRGPWWMWCGGFIGAVYVLGNVYLVPIIGTGLSVVIVLVGLIVGSMLTDQLGLFDTQRRPVSLAQILSLLVMILGVILIRIV